MSDASRILCDRRIPAGSFKLKDSSVAKRRKTNDEKEQDHNENEGSKGRRRRFETDGITSAAHCLYEYLAATAQLAAQHPDHLGAG